MNNNIGLADRTPDASRNVVAVLGPTNTGKTHLAIERMLAHRDGMIGLPLRLLAREVYNRVAARVGADQVALITGEEKIIPDTARYRVCTVEAMPDSVDVSFLAIDEIQLAADLGRGHVFTDRILNLRGRDETLLLGAATMRAVIEKLVPGVNVVTRPRMSLLTYAGSKKITRLPTRSAVVAFTSDEVYAIAELIRRQRGGAAVVLGALSPRTRNAQVELFQSGDVDFLVATDAIGMGLNLDVHHVAFAANRKFDGFQFRALTAAELGQVAGRAGRHMRDGTFGVTSRVDPFDPALVEALETHRFDTIKTVQWRSRDLDFTSLDALKASLDQAPAGPTLSKALPADDVNGLHVVSRDPKLSALADRPERIALLWDVCQVPDYRKIAPAVHAELVNTVFTFLAQDGTLPDDWFARQIAFADRTDGDIDTLSNRIAHVRTWTFAANRKRWLKDPAHWQERTSAIEDRLSDALHARLTARFVDRRTSVLMRRLKENVMLEAEITDDGEVHVEGQHVGALDGFRFAPDPSAAGPEAKALRAAAQKALAGEILARAEKATNAPDADFALSLDGALRWNGTTIARISEGEDALKPRLLLLADDALPEAARERVQTRIELWLSTHCQNLLRPLFDLREAASLSAPARGVAFRLAENLGTIERSEIAEEVRGLDQDARAGMRALGVRFGAYHIYVPALLKPAPGGLVAMIWALKNGGLEAGALQQLTQLAASGRTSVPVDPGVDAGLYRAVGYSVSSDRAVRLDILERLADLIRPLIGWRPSADATQPPEGAIDGFGFTVTVEMTSLLGCAGEDFSSVLRALGYRSTKRPAPPPQSSSQSSPETSPEASAQTSAETSAVPSPEPVAASTTEAPVAPSSEAAPDAVDGESAPSSAEAPGPETAILPSGELESTNITTDASPTEEAAPDAKASPPAPAAPAAPAASEPGASPSAQSPAGSGNSEPPTAQSDRESAPEPDFIEVWRPARQDRARGGRQRRPEKSEAEGAQGPQEAKATKGPPRGKSGQRPGRKNQDRRAASPKDPRAHGDKRQGNVGRRPAAATLDPNSPFAALAGLKAELEAKERDS